MHRSIVQAALIIAAAAVLALVSNAIASRDRKLVLPGYYPDAMRVPMHQVAAPLPVVPVTTTTAAPTTSGGQTPSPVQTSAVQTSGGQAPSPVHVAPPTTATAARVVLPSRRPAEGRPEAGTTPKADPLAFFTPHPDKAYAEVDYDGAATLQKNGALVLDARRTSVYEQGHIAGARSFSVWESDIDDKVNKLFEERNDPREQLKPILIYCSGGDCEDSHMLAQKLWGVQFNNIYVYREGFPDWQKRGGPIHTGTTP